MNAVGSVSAIVLGLLAWLVPSALTGGGEAWDHPMYFQIALPALLVGIFFLGVAFPIRAWRWGPLAMAGQAVAVVLSGNGSLLPVGIALLAIISIPLAGVGWLGSKLRKPEPGVPLEGPGRASRDSRREPGDSGRRSP